MFGIQLLGIVFAVVGIFTLLRPWWPSSHSPAGSPIILADIMLLRHRYLSGTVSVLLGAAFIIIGMQGLLLRTIPEELALLSDGLVIAGIVTVVVGLLFLFRPLALVRISTLLDDGLGRDAFYARRPKLWGSLFLVSGVILLGISATL